MMMMMFLYTRAPSYFTSHSDSMAANFSANSIDLSKKIRNFSRWPN